MLYLTLAINIVSMIALIAGILMHSGRGGGLSDMFGGGGGAALGSTAAERNLNRITFVFALIWLFTVMALPFLFEFWDDTLRNAREVEDRIELPVLASVREFRPST